MKAKVVVAMSGGVDSSVAAYLLKKQGYDVTGVFLRFWSPDDKKSSLCSFENQCCSQEAKEQAEKTARLLNIPFFVLDARKFFKEKIVDYFIKEYRLGKTPNPCVMCGKYIKFDFLHNKARRIFDADYVATGHYAKIKKIGKTFRLLKGEDNKKDQSYFLYTASQDNLSNFLLPIGGYKKSEVREIARRAKLPSYKRPESQEICFIPNNDYHDFLEKYSSGSIKRGWIVDVVGNKIKEHNGIAFFTIGQRRGIGVAGKVPYYVVGINAKKNEVIIGEGRHLLSSECYAEKVNWVSGKALEDGTLIDAKVRYSMDTAKARIYNFKNKTKVEFIKPVKAIAPGQSVVFYKGKELLGGGIIK